MVARNAPAASLLRHLHGMPLGWLPCPYCRCGSTRHTKYCYGSTPAAPVTAPLSQTSAVREHEGRASTCSADWH